MVRLGVIRQKKKTIHDSVEFKSIPTSPDLSLYTVYVNNRGRFVTFYQTID